MNDELAFYAKQVADLASAKRAGERIANRSVDHAAVLMTYLVAAASAKIRLLCGGLDVAFYARSDLGEALKKFLTKTGAHLLILTKDRLAGDHPFMAEFAAEIAEKKVDFRFSDQVLPLEGHFAVIDEEAYRYEFKHDSQNKDVVEAVASFFEPVIAKGLAVKFDRLFAEASS